MHVIKKAHLRNETGLGLNGKACYKRGQGSDCIELNQPPREDILIKEVHVDLKCSKARINTAGL